MTPRMIHRRPVNWAPEATISKSALPTVAKGQEILQRVDGVETPCLVVRVEDLGDAWRVHFEPTMVQWIDAVVASPELVADRASRIHREGRRPVAIRLGQDQLVALRSKGKPGDWEIRGPGSSTFMGLTVIQVDDDPAAFEVVGEPVEA